MRIPVVAYLLLFVPTASMNAQTEPKVLRELDQVTVLVERMGAAEAKLGLTEDGLESQALVSLRRDIPQLKIGKSAISYVYVRVGCSEIHSQYGETLGL